MNTIVHTTLAQPSQKHAFKNAAARHTAEGATAVEPERTAGAAGAAGSAERPGAESGRPTGTGCS